MPRTRSPSIEGRRPVTVSLRSEGRAAIADRNAVLPALFYHGESTESLVEDELQNCRCLDSKARRLAAD